MKQLQQHMATELVMGISIVLVILVLLVYYRRKVKQDKTNIQTHLALNIIGRTTGKTIILLKSHFPRANIEIVTSSLPSGFELRGFFRKKLVFSWKAELTVKSLGLSQVVPQKVTISFIEAWALRKILHESYLVVPILSDGARIKTLTIESRLPQNHNSKIN